jgi:hypothetical protein
MLDSSLFRKFLLGFFPFAVGRGKDSLTVFGPRKMRAREDCFGLSSTVFVKTAVWLSLLDRTTQLMTMGFQFPGSGFCGKHKGKRGLQMANLV